MIVIQESVTENGLQENGNGILKYRREVEGGKN